MKDTYTGVGLVLFGVVFALGDPVFAADEQPAEQSASALAEVVVTARKRDESLQDIPLSVSVFNSEQILKADIRSLNEVSKFTPGFKFDETGMADPGRIHTQLKFRGLTTAQFSPSFSTGALFIDGIYVQNGGTSLSLMDLERIEVVKGPQAAYFGRNTFGGAVNLITRDPSMEHFAGEANLRTTDRSNNEISALIEGPIVPGKLSFNLSGRKFDKRGHYVANDGERLGNQETSTINAVLNWKPTESLSFKSRYTYSEDHDGQAAQAFISGARYDTCTGTTIDTGGGQVSPKNYVCGRVPYAPGVAGRPGTGEISVNGVLPHYFVSSRNFYLDDAFTDPSLTISGVPRMSDLGLKRESERFSLFGDYETASGYTISANYGHNRQRVNVLADGDVSDMLAVFTRSPQDLYDESYEVRLTSPQDRRFRWLVGYNQYKQEFTGSGGSGDSALTCFGSPQSPPSDNYPADCVGGVPGAFVVYTINTLGNSDVADVTGIFGSIDFDILDNLTLSLEGRWQEDKLTKGEGVIRPGAPVLSDSFDDFLPRVILRWQPAPTTTLYVNYAEGQIAGEFNPPIISANEYERAQFVAQNPDLKETLDAETLEAWEIGWKQVFWGGRGQMNLAVYDYVWENIKGRSQYPINFTCRPEEMDLVVQCSSANGIQAGDPEQIPGPDGQLIPYYFPANVLAPGDAKIRGAELEAQVAFTDSLSGGIGVSYIDSKYTDYLFNFVEPIAGFKQMAGRSTPRQPKWSGNANLTWNGKLGGRDSYLRGDWIYTGESFVDESNLAYVDSYQVVNVRSGLRLRDQWQVELFVTNLFEEEGWATGARRTDFARAIQLPSLNSFQGVVVTPLDKREFGVRINFTF